MTFSESESFDNDSDKSAANAPDNSGHRKRLREKFIKSGFAGFHDYEIIELLLSLSTPRRNTKPQAKEALTKFKTLQGVLEASLEELKQIKGIGEVNALSIKVVQEVAREFLKEKIIGEQVFRSSQEVFQFLYHSMRDLKKEVFKVIYLDSQNRIIGTEDLFEGTVNSSPVSTREVIQSAIKNNAVSLIFVHNHPSGNPDPSQADKDLTRDLVYASNIMNIKVLDHVIIGNNKYYSFAGTGLIEESELSFITMKTSGLAEAKKRL